MMPSVPKPEKRSKAQKRADALEKRVWHYGGSDDWPALKERVFSRDRWRCLLCQRSAHDGFALQVAHVRSVGMGGVAVGTPSAEAVSDPSNLATLCVDCHRQVDQGVERDAWRARLRLALDASIERERMRAERAAEYAREATTTRLVTLYDARTDDNTTKE